ncbi:MAG: prenyltransferase [Spirochaetes bacterium]|nr:prenyltransferase [Spirochaetota bacterium]
MTRLRRKVQGLLTLFRFELPFFAGACVVVGEMLALGAFPPAKEALLGFFSVFLISATALILNDYFDLETDRINAPHRPLPSGAVKRWEALVLSIVITVAGLAAGYALSLPAFGVALLLWLVGFLYNWRYKKSGLLGNLMVSVSVGMTFIYGAIAVGRPSVQLVWLFGAIAMLIDLGEEIAADALDVEGDRASGSRSIAVLHGPERAFQISAAIFGVVIVMSIVPFIAGWIPRIYFIPLAVMDVVIFVSSLRLLRSDQTGKLADIRRIYITGGMAMVALLVLRTVA